MFNHNNNFTFDTSKNDICYIHILIESDKIYVGFDRVLTSTIYPISPDRYTLVVNAILSCNRLGYTLIDSHNTNLLTYANYR